MDENLITPYQFLTGEEESALRDAMPDVVTVRRAAEFFKIFGDQTRLSILFALQAKELCVGDLAAFLDMTPSAISHQLKLLKSAELVKFRREGKVLLYSPADDHIKVILDTGSEHIQE